MLCKRCSAEIDEAVEKTLASTDAEPEGYPIVCDDCGKDATVPFKPNPGWSKFCRDCYKKRNPR